MHRQAALLAEFIHESAGSLTIITGAGVSTGSGCTSNQQESQIIGVKTASTPETPPSSPSSIKNL